METTETMFLSFYKVKLQMKSKKQRYPGFTLAELLISLAILGVIATFTIPKILLANQQAQRLSVFKETLSSISAILNQGIKDGGIQTAAVNTNGTYIINHLNALKICSSNSISQGCWPPPDFTTWVASSPGVILHNGASIAGLSDVYPQNHLQIVVDWNGLAEPNVHGDDQLRLLLALPGYTSLGGGITGPQYPGIIIPYWGDETLYREIFQ